VRWAQVERAVAGLRVMRNTLGIASMPARIALSVDDVWKHTCLPE